MDTAWGMVVDFTERHESTLIEIGVTLLIAFTIIHFGQIIIGRIVSRAIRASSHKTKAEERKREKTITQIVSGALKVLIWPFTVVAIAGQLGFSIGPLLAGAGIVGVALGFGAQSLVKDLIAGLFIIVENQYGVGDVVQLDTVGGMVEEITLRKTKLRYLDGVVHHIPNGTIVRSSNMSSEFSGINLDIRVSYDSDINQVIGVINMVGVELASDPVWGDLIIEAPTFLRVDDLGPSEIVIKITGKVQPLAQWEVTGEMRQRIKVAFKKAHIDIPFPQSVVHNVKG